ncbi:type I restriction-modification system subunit M [Rhodanobacter denitrificans]|uniref:class I SAM-dependent DNA methyltransferase n=1 Tax=Rhodanobacter denitrificans TaxID=666685 RepID=UPI00022D8799|nr:class I SAM-dependent DNA methyltransferase [Rhodanobacter denitrificans]EIM00471.1 N-6 DNA methylase [Rhodanobacter denitrificans]UJM86066.1 type I restriction-modification system subunit M [Rhodanobacter denitrificans]UJM90900.1 type I restriction-modification system subunit M [Rhodanobacter denitrificans]
MLGLIFLKFADNNYHKHEAAILAEYGKHKGKRAERELAAIAIEQCGFYLPEHARYDYLLNLPDDQDIARAIKLAMQAIEQYKPELAGVLPQDEYFRLTRSEQNRGIPRQLLKNFADIPADADGDMFGQIYEYFLGEFAMSEGQGGGEFFTPRSVVRLMVGIIQPHGGTVYDPACGSGGMFVQSAHFIEQQRRDKAEGGADIYVYGQEKTLETVKLAKMNLAVNGLRGEIKQANTYYEDPHDSFGAFDYVLANPPFNVDDVSLGSVEGDRRFNTYGIPRNKTKVKKADEGKQTVPNGNYLWINLFATSLNEQGRAALVMANSASDARHSEADIRKALIEANLIYGMLTLPSNMFYTVTLPATLWFFDKAKADDHILFIDARNVFTQVDRAHREFSDEQVRNLALISQLHLGDRHEFIEAVDDYFAAGFAALAESHAQIAPLAEQLLAVLDDAEGQQAVAAMQAEWAALKPLQARYAKYRAKAEASTSTEASNRAQLGLREHCDPFFVALHADLKQLDKRVRAHEKKLADAAQAEGRRGGTGRDIRALKVALDALHAEVRRAEYWFGHVRWLQERFPNAEYEDVTGLCKLATPAEVAEQEYSLNPGRYAGVVIEEDGKTEEEFVAELLAMNEEFAKLNEDARTLEDLISSNLKSIVDMA